MAEPLKKTETGLLGAERARRGALERLARSGSPLAARVATMRDLAAAAAPAEPAAWSTVLPELAALFPAGLPRGELVELAGRRSAGRFGFALALVAAATGAGENAALVDLGDGLDPQQAEAVGVVLARLLWARPRDSRQALAAAEALVGGGFPLVVVDLGLPPVAGGRGAEAHWLRLARAAREARSLAVVSAPYRVCGVAAGLALELDRAGIRWNGSGLEPRLLKGVETRLEAVKPHLERTAAGRPLRLAAS
jgi:hypothetical protein